MKIGFLHFIFVMLFTAFVFKGSSQVVVHESIEDSIVVSEITCFIDHLGVLSKDEVETLPFSSTIEQANELLAKHNPKRRFWFKFSAEAFDSIEKTISVSLPSYSRITVYVLSPEGNLFEKRVGAEDIGNYYFVDHNQKTTAVFDLGTKVDILVSVRHRSRMQDIKSFRVLFATQEFFEEAKMQYRPSKGGEGYLFLLFCGIMMFQGLYVLLQWYLVRKREYFYYGAFILSIFIYYYLRFSAFYSENMSWALTDTTDLYNYNDSLLIIPSIFYLLFASSFVDLKSKDKKLYKLITGFQIFLLLCLMAQLLLQSIPNDINKMIPILVVLLFHVPFNIYALIRIARQRRRVAWFLVIGSSVAFLSHLIANLLPIISPSSFAVISPLEVTMIGLIIEVIIFNGGLLVKAKELDLQRIVAQNSYIKELKNRQAIQGEFAEVRDKISSDLHDDVGSSLSSIGIYSYAAKENLNAGKIEQAAELLENIKRSAEATLNAMSDLVWATNPRNDSNEKLIERIRSFGYEILSARECVFKVHIDHDFYAISLNQAQRKNLLLILKEAINNSAKYSEATLVDLTIRVQSNSYSVLLSDNGVGFDSRQRNEGNGMTTMRKRSAELNGEFELNSTDSGTELVIHIRK